MDELFVVLFFDISVCVSVNLCSIVCESIYLGEYGCPDCLGWYWVWWDSLVHVGDE